MMAYKEGVLFVPRIVFCTMLDQQKIKALAAPYGLDVAAVLAVAQVESGGRSGFQSNGELTVLFEAHLFYKELRNVGLNPDALMARYPNLISPVWNRALYKGGDAENVRLAEALKIHPCALKCASYGMFQILGSNCRACGFATPEEFIAFLKTGTEAQVGAFLKFVSSNPAMLVALKIHDWATFARLYNGPGYAQNQYDTKIAAAYQKISSSLDISFFMADLNLLKPKVKMLAEQLVTACKAAGITIIVTQTLRTIAEQDALFAQGRTKPGPIVTKAKGGFSLHNYGVAFDIVPVVNGKTDYSNATTFACVGEIGQRLGLEWGGAWATFPDKPHFQFLAGYTLADFQNKKIDEQKFALAPVMPLTTPTSAPFKPLVPTPQPSAMLKVTATVLNVRSGPAATFTVLGQLKQNDRITPLERKDGWVKISYKNAFGWVSAAFVG